MKPSDKSDELKAQEEALKDTDALKLPDDVAKSYTVKPGIVRMFIDAGGGGVLIDLNKINVAKAEKLAARGILIKKP
jgi:hypothetical protein